MQKGWSHHLVELRAVLIVGLAVFLIVGVAAYKKSEPSIIETGKVVRFGSYASDLGDRPTVIVITEDGHENTIVAPPGSLNRCSTGSRISVIRRPHSLSIAPIGCE